MLYSVSLKRVIKRPYAYLQLAESLNNKKSPFLFMNFYSIFTTVKLVKYYSKLFEKKIGLLKSLLLTLFNILSKFYFYINTKSLKTELI